MGAICNAVLGVGKREIDAEILIGTSMELDLARKETPTPAVHLPGKPAYEEGDRTVDNPFAILPDLHRDPMLPPEPKTHVVKVNTRETPIEFMWARRLISYEEKIVADWFRKSCEDMRVEGGVIDPERIRVDTSPWAHLNYTETILQASRNLIEARKRLGFYDYQLLVEACDVGRPLSDLVRRWYVVAPGSSLEREMILHVGRRIRDALGILTAWLIKALEPKSGRKISGYRSFSGLTADRNSWDAPAPTREEAAALAKARRRHRHKRRR